MIRNRLSDTVVPWTHRWARSTLFLLALGLLLAVAAGPGYAQSASPCGPNAACLTQALVTLNARYQAASGPAQAPLLTELLTLAAIRQQVLVGLVESDPGAVLQQALPADQRQSLPPAVQALVEEAVALEGTLEVLHEDRDTGSRYLHFLQTASARLALHFAAEPPTDLPTGTRVRVRGVQVGGALALSSGGSVSTLVAIAPNTFGAQKTLVMLVIFADSTTQPYTVASAQSVFATTSNFDWDNSYQQTSLTSVVDSGQAADVRGWYPIALTSTNTGCDYSTLASQAQAAAQADGVNLAAYSRYVYAFPNWNACTWWGLGTVGGNPSKAWINGSLQVRVTAHEMGHNFGLYHSHSMSCATSGCTTSEYGDGWDDMGATVGHYNAFQKERLGWLNYGASPPLTAVTVDGTYWLEPYEPDSANPKALKLWKSTDSTGKNTYYYVEYRTKLGFDSGLASGVLVHTGSESSANSSYLWDLDPTTTTSDWVLGVGQSYTDAQAGVTLSTVSADSTGASVQVAFGPVPCAGANPTVALSPSGTQSIAAGASVDYTVTVTDNDSANCPAATFTLQATAPTTGWTAAFASASLTLSPGSPGSTTLTLTASSTAGGLYSIPVTAANGSSVGTTSATVSILTPCANANPTVALSPTSQWVKTGTTAVYTVTVTNNDNSSCTASSFSLSAALPSGWTAAFASTTLPLISPGASGSTTLAVTSSATTPDGFYSLTVTATNSAAPAYTGSVSALQACLLSLAVKATTDKSSYPSPSFVTITVNVRVGQTPIANASVTITVAKTGSSGTTLTGTTDGNGNIVVKYKVGPKGATGTYQVMAAATANGFSGSDNTATFKVQ